MAASNAQRAQNVAPIDRADEASSEGGLKRVLGVSALTFYGVGIILGAGIYSVLGAAAVLAGDTLWLSF